ncbi:PLP-dependent cysteine synthase family protein [Caballeronia sp. DA-9]|uniref:PLP-dependent cysteine synthase family protein n=1 Tax=Caballeronia sp. DA-9 TaxID=3436237 RepID=UPI003F66C22D
MTTVIDAPDAKAPPTAKHQVTDLLEVLPGLLAKFECNNAGGSHKVRAARYIVDSAIATGAIVPGQTTVIEKTGGNFGFGLALACRPHRIRVELAVGLGFSQLKRQYLAFVGARLVGASMMEKGATPRDVVQWHLEHADELGRHYFYTDQFANKASVAAHELETAPEIAHQLAAWPHVRKLTFVACAGTGASLTGIANGLISAGYCVDVILVEPDGCDARNAVFVDHKLEGMSVGVAPPFLDWAMIKETRAVDYANVAAAKSDFARRTGFLVGNTTAACLSVAMPLAATMRADSKVLTLVYDHGLWYTPA